MAKGEILSNGFGNACLLLEKVHSNDADNEVMIRLKTPTPATVRWLLRVAGADNIQALSCGQTKSCWRGVERVGFYPESYGRAVLLSNVNSYDLIESTKIFDEWRVPISSPSRMARHAINMASINRVPLLHRSKDKRDWMRWLDGVDVIGKIIES